MKTFLVRLFKVLVLCVPLATTTCLAQFSGQVQGTVQDKTGAAISGAAIALQNTDTQVVLHATSDKSGVFRFVSLPPGPYDISATAEGFAKTSVVFTLTAAETRNIPIALPLASLTTNVTVSSQAPLLDTSDSRLQLTLNNSALQNLPLNARNPTALVSLTPGVTGHGNETATNFNPEDSIDVSANGRGQNGNQWIVDGLDAGNAVRPGELSLTPNVDSLSEVSVQTNTYDVDYGRASSIETIMTTRSGTSQYHGFAGDYYTYQGLQARGEFGVPQPQPLAPYHTNNMSFGIGGPVIPKHRLFFYFSIEPYLAITSTGSQVVSYEDPQFVSFAQQAEPNNPELALLTKYPPVGAVFRSVAQTAQQAFGPQDTAANTGCATPSSDNIPCGTAVFDYANFNSSSFNRSKQFNVRIDKYFDRDRIYGNIYRGTVASDVPNLRPIFQQADDYYTTNLQVNETHTFSPHLLNEAIFGYNRIEGSVEPSNGVFSLPAVYVGGLGVGWNGGWEGGDYVQHNYMWRDVLNYVRSNHSFKLGAEGWTGDNLAYFAGAYGVPQLYYVNMIDLINDQPYSESGLAYNPVTGQPAIGNYGYASTTGGAFAEDTWKANRKLTVNYGVRYDNFGNSHATSLGGVVLTNFHLGDGSTFQEQIANGVLKRQQNTLTQDMNWVFSPRAGFAYDPAGNGKWVVKGGFGVYRDWYTNGEQTGQLRTNPPSFATPTFYNNGSTAPPVFSYGGQKDWPYGFTYPAFQGTPLNAAGGIVGAQIAIGGVDVNLRTPTTLSWSAAVERELTRTMVITAGYVGSRSYDQVTDAGVPNTTNVGIDVNAYAGDLLQHPIFNPDGSYSGSGTQTRLNPNFGEISYAFNGTKAAYEAVIVGVKGRFSQRGFITASYTRSTAKDNSQEYPEYTDLSKYYGPSIYDAPNRVSVGFSYELPGASEGRGIVGRLSSGWVLGTTLALQSGNPFTVYTGAPLQLLTIGKDGSSITSANYAAELAGGNLQFAPTSGDFNADGNGYDFPSVTTYSQKHDRKSYEIGNGIFALCANGVYSCGQFSQPNPGQDGNELVNRFQGPGYADADLSVKKVTSIADRLNLEFRLDTFNLFNRVNLTPVDADLEDGAYFGTTGGTYPARNLLAGVKLQF